MFQILDRARELEEAGENVIHLELGDPSFPTPANISEAGIDAIKAGKTHYVSSWGLPDFRQSIIETTEKSRGFRPKLNQVLVTPGVNVSIYMIARVSSDPGDNILVPNPGFPTYISALLAAEVEPRPYKLRGKDGFVPNKSEIEKLIDSRTRAILINSPGNPTGAVFDEQTIRGIYEIARKHNLYLISDEIYARIILDAQKSHFSPASVDRCERNTILINGFSKAFSMTGWRLGSIIGPEEIMPKLMLYLQTLISCVPPFVQEAGIAALKTDVHVIEKMSLTYKRRMEIFVSEFENASRTKVRVPSGAFYLMLNISDSGMSGKKFASLLLEEYGVATVPGEFFGDEGAEYVRLSFAGEESDLPEAANRIARALSERKRV